MNPIPRSLAWWHGREPREHVMLAVMAVLVAAFIGWYGLLWPLRALRDGAGEHYDRAAAALQTTEAEVATLAGTAAPPPPDGGETLQHRLLESARGAGLAPSRQRTAEDGAFVLEFEGVAPPALFGWLGQLAEGDGLVPSSLRIERAEGGLRAEVGFGGAAP